MIPLRGYDMKLSKAIAFLMIPGIIAIFIGCAVNASAKVPLVVPTAYGPVLGNLSFGDVRVFKGIPYAAPPVGELRWKAPKPPEPWKLPLLCDVFKSSCPSYPSTTDIDLQLETFDEDCLYLNVWTPAEDAEAGLPVMVYIHGGSFLTGSAAKRVYDGSYLAERGVIVVTINYRLGVFGFFCHPGLADASTGGSYGNYGLLDQIAAIKWVKENIKGFGGNPDNITIFGESAGAVSVLTLMSSTLSEGLFQGAIAQSGAIPFGLKTSQDACQLWARMASKIGVDDFGTSLDELKLMNWEQILKMNPSNDGNMPAKSTLDLLCLDGYLLKSQPLDVFIKGDQAKVPLIVGSNSDEMGISSSGGPDTLEDYKARLGRYFPGFVAKIIEHYPFDEATPGRAYMSAIGDVTFTYSSRLTSILHSQAGNAVYNYIFAYAGKLLRSAGIGAFHASDLLYVFGIVDTPAFPSDEREVARLMADYWSSFSKTGKPSHEGRTAWQAFTQEDPAAMYLDVLPRMDYDLVSGIFKFWSGIMASVVNRGGF